MSAPLHLRPRMLVALAALVATSGCAALVDFDGDPFVVGDGGVNGDDDDDDGGHRGDATTPGDDDDDDTGDGGGRDAKADADATPPFDACTATGWHLDCNFGDAGFLTLPTIPSDAGADAGGQPYDTALYIGVGSDGTVYTASTLENDALDVEMCAVTDAGAGTPLIVSGAGRLEDARVFDGSTLFLLANDSQGISVLLSSVTNGVLTGPVTYGGITAEGYTPANPLGLIGSTAGTTRALLQYSPDGDDPQLQIVDFTSGGAHVEAAGDVDGQQAQGAGVSVAVDGTWIAVDTMGNTGAFATPEVYFQPTGASSLAAVDCDAPIEGGVADIATLGASQVVALTGGAMLGSTLFEYDHADGGSCAQLSQLPATADFLPTGLGQVAAADGGFTLTLSGQSGASSGFAVANVSPSGALDTTVGQAGYTSVTMPTNSALGTGVLFGDTLYVPFQTSIQGVKVSNTLVRFVRTH